MYQVTTKLAHGLYHGATVVDYNLNLKYLITGDVNYPAHSRLKTIEVWLYRTSANKNCTHVMLFVPCDLPYLGIS